MLYCGVGRLPMDGRTRVPYDRTAIMKARRGGLWDPDHAARLQQDYGREIAEDIRRQGLSINGVARELGLNPGTLKGYVDGKWPFPVGVIHGLAPVLNRSATADMVAVGYQTGSGPEQMLLLDRRLRLATRVMTGSAPIGITEEPGDTAGARLASLLTSSPAWDDHDWPRHTSSTERSTFGSTPALDVRILRLPRGIRHTRKFGELLVVDWLDSPPRGGTDLRTFLLDLPVKDWSGRATATFNDALNLYGAMIEDGADFRERLRRDFGAGPTAVMVVVPTLLARRSPVPTYEAGYLERFDGIGVTSLHWGGSADVAALVGRQHGWGFLSAGKLTQQFFGGPPRSYGGQYATVESWRDMTPADRLFHRNCGEITELLFDPVFGRRTVGSLDEPLVALDVLTELPTKPAHDVSRSPLVMLRMSSRRIRFTAGRRALTRPGGGAVDDELAAADHRNLVTLQDELTRAVESAHLRQGRPAVVVTIPESEADYDRTDIDTTDQDFDAFVEASDQVAAALRSL